MQTGPFRPSRLLVELESARAMAAERAARSRALWEKLRAEEEARLRR